MLLATKSGWLILVNPIETINGVTKVQSIDTKETYQISDKETERKLFDKSHSKEEIQAWMEK